MAAYYNIITGLERKISDDIGRKDLYAADRT